MGGASSRLHGYEPNALGHRHCPPVVTEREADVPSQRILRPGLCDLTGVQGGL